MVMFDLIWPFDLILTMFFGLCLGSFTTAVTWRELHGVSWAFPGKGTGAMATYRSTCPSCGHKLGVMDLIPIVSWVMLRGRCRYCAQPISRFYPLIELFVLLLCLALYWRMGWGLDAAIKMLCVPFLMALVVVDFKRMILPNMLVGIIAVLGLIHGVFLDAHGHALFAAIEHLLTAILYGGFAAVLGALVSFILKKDALGGGDVKFFAAAGMWLGAYHLPAFCILSGVMGIVSGMIWQKVTGRHTFPFGPALIMALYVLWLFDGSFFLYFM